MTLILTLGVSIFILYFLVKVLYDFVQTKKEMDMVEQANAEFGAAFIRIALKHDELRNGDPSKINIDVMKLQKEEDLLIESYKARLKEKDGHSFLNSCIEKSIS